MRGGAAILAKDSPVAGTAQQKIGAITVLRAIVNTDAGSLVEGQVREVDDGPPIHALIPAGRRMPPKTRVVLDRLVEFFKR